MGIKKIQYLYKTYKYEILFAITLICIIYLYYTDYFSTEHRKPEDFHSETTHIVSWISSPGDPRSSTTQIINDDFSIVNDIVCYRYKKYYQNHIDNIKDIFIDRGVNLKEEPAVFRYFDYKIHGDQSVKYNEIKGNPKEAKIVYCHPKRVLNYKFSELSTLSKGNKRILIAMGADTHSSKLNKNMKKNLLTKFNTIFWEGNDDPDFMTLPMGLNLLYVAKNGIKQSENAIKNAIYIDQRKLCIIPAWNLFSKGLFTPSRDRLSKFVINNKGSMWYERKTFIPSEYYKGISQYKFTVCPTGNGIQAPKIIEAILVRTIPVVENELVFRQLKQLGLPLLIVDTWNDMSEKFLNQQYNKMYKTINWENAIYLCSIKGFIDIVSKYL